MTIHKSENDQIPAHESPVRRIIADTEKISYKSIQSFDEAKKILNAVVIFEGDYGGQIYLTCPLVKVKCSEKTLKQLIADIDTWCWNNVDSTGIYYELREKNEGMGGGIIKTDAWIHHELIETNLDSQIRQVLDGEINRIQVTN